VSDLDLGAWLVLGAALFAWGLLAVMTGRGRGGTLVGAVLMLASAALDLAAFVQHAILPAAAITCLVLALILGALLVLVAVVMLGGEESP